MSHELQKVRVRNALKPRREPYWSAPIAKGKFVGLRKSDTGSSTWIARLRDESGQQQYKSLGHVTDSFGFDEAKAEAEKWFRTKEAGISDEVVSVADACKEYVKDRKREKGESTAHDAKMRFERTVYNTAFGRRPLAKLRTQHIKVWRDELGLSPASSNRTLTALKAALNLAVMHRQVSADTAQEWRNVKPLPGAGKRRDLYLDLKQRRALLAACSGAVRDLIEAAMLTGARPGELVKATCRQFSARTASMTFIGKTGTRTVPLAPGAVTLFKRRSKQPDDLLLTRDDGKPWAHSDWDELVREAAEAAELPAGCCLYTLRHSFITTAINEGMNTLEVARMVGTSVMMIERHYGHLAQNAARARLAKVKIL